MVAMNFFEQPHLSPTPAQGHLRIVVGRPERVGLEVGESRKVGDLRVPEPMSPSPLAKLIFPSFQRMAFSSPPIPE
jgi:hypothetical protein